MKYTDKAVTWVEGVRNQQIKKGVLFNAPGYWRFLQGATENIIFGFVEADEVGEED
jgi:hypothetical protein